MIPVGRSVIVPANGSLPNIVLSPRVVSAPARARARALRRPPPARADDAGDLHLARSRSRPSADRRDLARGRRARLDAVRRAVWGFLLDRIDHRIAVSRWRRASAARWLPGDYEVIPNGVLIPPAADPAAASTGSSSSAATTRARACPCCSQAWPEIHRRTGARLRLVGADPLAVRLLLSRTRVSDEGIDVLGFLSQEQLTAELLAAKALVAPVARRRELRHGADARVRLRDAGRRVRHPGVPRRDDRGHRAARPAGRRRRARRRARSLLADEPRREAIGARARRSRSERYSWDDDRRAARSRSTSRCWPPEARRGSARPRDAGSARPRARRRRSSIVLLWWRGPDWAASATRSRRRRGSGCVVAIGFNLLSVVARALAWQTVIDAGDAAAAPALPPRLLGVLGRAARERGAAGPGRRARPRRAC